MVVDVDDGIVVDDVGLAGLPPHPGTDHPAAIASAANARIARPEATCVERFVAPVPGIGWEAT